MIRRTGALPGATSNTGLGDEGLNDATGLQGGPTKEEAMLVISRKVRLREACELRLVLRLEGVRIDAPGIWLAAPCTDVVFYQKLP